MRRRKLTDEERAQLSFSSAPPPETTPSRYTAVERTKPIPFPPKSEWPVHHPEVLPYLSPVSDETGGPLNAREAGRVVTKQSIRFAGHKYASGQVVCRSHEAALDGKDHGYRMTVYSGTAKDADVGWCAICAEPVRGEDPK